MARRGVAWLGKGVTLIWRYPAIINNRIKARLGEARLGKAWPGRAWRGEARLGKGARGN